MQGMSSENSSTHTSSTFWQEYLLGAQPTYLPALPPLDTSTTRGIAIQETHESWLVRAAIPELVLLASWTSILTTYTLADDIVFGLVLGGDSVNDSNTSTVVPLRVPMLGNDDTHTITERMKSSLQLIKQHTNIQLPEFQALDKSTRSACKLGSLVIIRPPYQHQLRDGQVHGQDSDARCGNSEPSFDTIAPLSLVCEHTDSSTELTIRVRSDLRLQCFAKELLHQFLKALCRFSMQNDLKERLASSNPPTSEYLSTWTRACEPVQTEQLLHTGVEIQSRLHPFTVAIGESESVMMYQELDVGASLLAQTLLSEVSISQNIGVCFEKSSFAILSMLAILKAGKTYVPLDVDWPTQRITYVTRDAQINVVLCSAKQATRFQGDILRPIVVDEDSIWQLKEKSSSPSETNKALIQINPTDAAYILYTSGSTGKPKGISVSHRAITTSLAAMARHFGISSKTRTFQHTTFTFDLSVADIWMTLSQGGRLCLPSEDERLDAGSFIVQERCNYAMATPSVVSTIEPRTWSENLQTLALIGEVVPERLLRDLATRKKTSRSCNFGIRNTWGPTEACVIASSSDNIHISDDDSRRLSPPANCIGYPVGCSIFLVSPTDPRHLVPAFAPGEIALVGHTLATCYYGNAQKTAEAFRTDLEWTEDSRWRTLVGDATAMGRVYLTGDIGRYSESGDGSVLFMYRKEQGYVKLNGYRIEPGEVESKIDEVSNGRLSRKGICVTVLDRGEKLAQRANDSNVNENEPRQVLVCFFVVGDNKQAIPGRGCAVSASAHGQDSETRQAVKKVVTALRESLPEYMVPRLFVPLESMPITTSHKIDRRYLLGMLEDLIWQDLVVKFGC